MTSIATEEKCGVSLSRYHNQTNSKKNNFLQLISPTKSQSNYKFETHASQNPILKTLPTRYCTPIKTTVRHTSQQQLKNINNQITAINPRKHEYDKH